MVLSDPIYQKVTVSKKELYYTIIKLMQDAGWTNIASHADDGEVMMSTGENNNRRILLPFSRTGYGIYGTTPFGETNTNGRICYRQIKEYISASDGSQGQFNYNGSTYFFSPFTYRYDSVISENLQIDLYYNINKNRILLLVDIPTGVIDSSGSPQNGGVWFAAGVMDNSLCDFNQHTNDGVIYAQSSILGSSITNNSISWVSPCYADGTIEAMNLLLVGAGVPRKIEPFTLYTVGYQTTSLGMLGVLDGIYMPISATQDINSVGAFALWNDVPTKNNGNIFTTNVGNKYKVFSLSIETTNNSYQSVFPCLYASHTNLCAAAIRIE